MPKAILSVHDKTGLVDFAKGLAACGWTLLASGGTAKLLRESGLAVTEVADYTGSPEILGGRVKTLHPAIHGGLLARPTAADLTELRQLGWDYIDLVAVNLYPFEQTIAKPNVTLAEAIENIDIGGVTLIRAAAKNHERVTLVCDPADYAAVLAEIQAGGVSPVTRARLAVKGFAQTAHYDAAIRRYLAGRQARPQGADPQAMSDEQSLPANDLPLRYGCNPHQTPARVYMSDGSPLPLEVLNGSPGYINLLDALNSWQLVKELRQTLGLPAAASFKHVSPSGAAVGLPLSETLKQVYFVADLELSPLASAYARARGVDRMSSFGDWVALSDQVDTPTAKLLNREVSDGVIAPAYDAEALDILRRKKGGKFVILAIDPAYTPPLTETRQVYGITFEQRRNDRPVTLDDFHNIVTQNKHLPESALRDMIVAWITLKYTQSNSVCFAVDGQVIGVGAGQQSRIHCTRLAGTKADLWWLRQYPAVLGLKFKPEVKRPDRDNAIDQFLRDDVTPAERAGWAETFAEMPQQLTATEKRAWLDQLSGVVLGSDAFFPFRDSIDRAAMSGVQYVLQPGGSNRDDAVIQACDEYGMTMVFSGVRLFHH